MLRWRLRTVLVAVAVVALVLATLVPAYRETKLHRAAAWVRAADVTRAVEQLRSPEVWAIVATDPAVAALPQIRAARDKGAAVGRLVRANIIPNTSLVEVGVQSPSPATATAVVNALTAQVAADRTARVITKATTASQVRPVGSLLRLVAADVLVLGVLGLIGWGVARLVARARPSGSADRAALEASAGIVDPWPRAGSTDGRDSAAMQTEAVGLEGR